MILPWFDVVLRPDDRFIRLAGAEGPDYVGGYLAVETSDQGYQLLHVWAAEDRRTDLFEGLTEADLQHVIVVLEQHMRRAPTFVQTTDVDTARALARLAARTGHFTAMRATPAPESPA